MNSKYTYYFETTSRLEVNCGIASGLRKQLETSNNFAWQALSEIQNVAESLNCLDSEQLSVHQKMLSALKDLSQQHKNIFEKSISDLNAVSTSIANDLEAVKYMLQEQEFFEFRKELEAVGKMVVNEFRKPATELSEAEELQELMKKFSSGSILN